MKFGYTGNNGLILDAYLNEKGQSVEIQWRNIFNNHQIVAKPGPTEVV